MLLPLMLMWIDFRIFNISLRRVFKVVYLYYTFTIKYNEIYCIILFSKIIIFSFLTLYFKFNTFFLENSISETFTSNSKSNKNKKI